LNALIFDCDGVIAETERDGHRVAFNRTFEAFGLPVHWSEAEYGEKLRISGGKERVASILEPRFVRANGIPSDPAGQRAWLERFHERKTAEYAALARSGAIAVRPGVGRVVDEARAAGWALAVASTSSVDSVQLTLEQTLGAERAAAFAVFAGDMVAVKKPDPAIYELARTSLGAARESTLVIEDSRNGLLAADAAGLACVVTPSSYTQDEDFREAALVVPSLEDVTLRELAAVLTGGRAT
jgi:HAD superfamily hydrolase (TIGR01509 family)